MKIDLSKLNEIYTFAIENEHSDFYRKLYGSSAPKKIDSLETWQSLPILTRDDIMSTPLADRLFYPYSEVEVIRATSGTSGKNALIVPRIGDIVFPQCFLDDPPQGLLIFYQPQHGFPCGRDAVGQNYPIIAGGFSDLEQSVRLAAKIKVDAIMCFPSLLKVLIPLLQKYGLTEQMRYIQLTGERPPRDLYAAFAEIFPNAHIYSDYGATEAQTIIGFNNSLDDASQNIFSPTKSFFWEVIDDESKTSVKEGEVGELVLTSLKMRRSAFPLLRYSMGDYVQALRDRTSNDTKWYKILGRPNVDMVKLTGGVLYADEVSRVLNTIHPHVTNDFEGHIYHEPKGVRLELRISTLDGKKMSDALLNELAQVASDRIRVGPNNTYSDAVKKGLYQKLTLIAATLSTEGQLKAKPFHQHYE